jgi:hypothetical protein
VFVTAPPPITFPPFRKHLSLISPQVRANTDLIDQQSCTKTFGQPGTHARTWFSQLRNVTRFLRNFNRRLWALHFFKYLHFLTQAKSQLQCRHFNFRFFNESSSWALKAFQRKPESGNGQNSFNQLPHPESLVGALWKGLLQRMNNLNVCWGCFSKEHLSPHTHTIIRCSLFLNSHSYRPPSTRACSA